MIKECYNQEKKKDLYKGMKGKKDNLVCKVSPVKKEA
jgi:hypothetical protein